jgi:hypothetical protein
MTLGKFGKNRIFIAYWSFGLLVLFLSKKRVNLSSPTRVCLSGVPSRQGSRTFAFGVLISFIG